MGAGEDAGKEPPPRGRSWGAISLSINLFSFFFLATPSSCLCRAGYVNVRSARGDYDDLRKPLTLLRRFSCASEKGQRTASS
jgi:hypothetical protein